MLQTTRYGRLSRIVDCISTPYGRPSTIADRTLSIVDRLSRIDDRLSPWADRILTIADRTSKIAGRETERGNSGSGPAQVLADDEFGHLRMVGVLHWDDFDIEAFVEGHALHFLGIVVGKENIARDLTRH